MTSVVIVVGAVLALPLVALFLLVRYVPNERIAVVEKRFSGRGSIKRGLIALHGEAGFAPTVLRGGFHWLNRAQYKLHILPLVTITQGKIGYVFARDGAPLEPTQTLASNRSATNFEDVAAFLAAGGQRGPQRMILREGTYAINLAQFAVITEEHVYFLPLNKTETAVFQEMAGILEDREGFRPIVIQGSEDRLGVVTVQDGPALSGEQIIAPLVGASSGDLDNYHNSFQDPEKFLVAGGRRGRQAQVLVEGTYYINRLFATVEMVPKTIIDVGSVGVVVSYTGELGLDLSGKDYKHGELVKHGERGVWSEPLLPGKYAFNTYAGKIIQVPTTNFILKWGASRWTGRPPAIVQPGDVRQAMGPRNRNLEGAEPAGLGRPSWTAQVGLAKLWPSWTGRFEAEVGQAKLDWQVRGWSWTRGRSWTGKFEPPCCLSSPDPTCWRRPSRHARLASSVRSIPPMSTTDASRPDGSPHSAAEPTELTRLLASTTAGDSAAVGRLLPMVYAELLDLARRQMRGAGCDHTPQPTALVHEAWLRIAGSNGAIRDRSHFWAIAATAMRQIPVDHARRKRRQKRGGGRARMPLEGVEIAVDDQAADVLALGSLPAATRESLLADLLGGEGGGL